MEAPDQQAVGAPWQTLPMFGPNFEVRGSPGREEIRVYRFPRAGRVLVAGLFWPIAVAGIAVGLAALSQGEFAMAALFAVSVVLVVLLPLAHFAGRTTVVLTPEEMTVFRGWLTRRGTSLKRSAVLGGRIERRDPSSDEDRVEFVVILTLADGRWFEIGPLGDPAHARRLIEAMGIPGSRNELGL